MQLSGGASEALAVRARWAALWAARDWILAGPSNRKLVILHRHFRYLPLRGRLFSFRFRTSSVAAFSIASSAYILFSLAFSVSSSRNRLSSDFATPAYLDFQLYYVANRHIHPRRIHSPGFAEGPSSGWRSLGCSSTGSPAVRWTSAFSLR